MIASNLGAMGEVVEHGRTGLHFTPGDAGDLANQAERLWNDYSLLQTMRVKARDRYLSDYTPERVYRRLMIVYGSVLNRPRPLNEHAEELATLA